MSFDNSRFTFQPWRDFLGVVMQQGRVQLDADWNEWVEEIDRRIRAGTLDTLGRAVVPRETPDGFLVTLTGGALAIGRGRIYVDGLLAENHGALPVGWDSSRAKKQEEEGIPITEWDPVLAELQAQGGVDYARQPYYPNAPEFPSKGSCLVYLDVWEREVTCLEQPDLIEKALGVDTTGRLQTVWQVKTLALRGNDKITCATPESKIPGWTEATASSAGRLTALTADVPGQPDPCIIPPSGGYKGLENQLYRVEIHDGGAQNAATFKWSRDNASIATRVTIIPDLSHLVVESTGKDDVLRFSDGDWIEISDDWLELNNRPGEIRRIAVGEGVDDATRTITLEQPISSGLFPVNAQQKPDQARHTRIRRWDQKGKVLQGDGSAWFDLDEAGSAGVIPVPPTGTSLLLENGIAVRFDLDPVGGAFKSGDCWTSAARTTDASIEALDKAPPRAIHHHYARLAVVTFPDDALDCRVFWPPKQAAGEGCDCSICVTAPGHNSGAATLQEAVNALAQTGGTICLGVGTYNLRETLRITNADSVRLRGQGPETVLTVMEDEVAIAIESSANVKLENLTVLGPASGSANGLVAISNTSFSGLSGLALISPASKEGLRASVTLAGYVLGLTVKDCLMMSDVGIANGAGKSVPQLAEMSVEQPLIVEELNISDNLMLCFRRGVNFTGQSLHYAETRIAGNLILNCGDSGLTVSGAVLTGSSLNVIGNTLSVSGSGIVIGTDGARIKDNDVTLTGQAEQSDGIALVPGLDPGGVDHCQIIGNRIRAAAQEKGIAGQGISIRTHVNSAMIKQNVIAGAGGGIVMEDDGSADYLSIENNQLFDIAAGFNIRGQAVPAAVSILASARADIVNNLVNGFARDAVLSSPRVAVQVVATADIRISGNRLQAVGPIGQFSGETVAVEILGPFTRANVSGNVLIRSGDDSEKLGSGNWQALRVGAAPREKSPISRANFTYSMNADTGVLFTENAVRFLRIVNGEFTVHGNSMESRNSQLSLVDVDGVENCIFTGNYCVLLTPSKTPLVLLQNSNVAVSDNRLRGPRGVNTMQIVSGKATVVGNFTTGDILLENGQSIFDLAPWESLNVRT